MRVVAGPQIICALLHPTFEIILRNFIWEIQKRRIGRQEFHVGIFVGDAQRAAFHFRGIRRDLRFQAAPETVALVFQNERAAIVGVIEQALIIGEHIAAQFVSANADDDGVKVFQIAEGERGGIEQVNLNSQALDGFRN